MAEPLSSEPAQECAYGPCRCPVDGDESYCSDFCEQADAEQLPRAERLAGRCGCGHEECP